MVEFDIKEAGNELLKILEKELGSRTIFRLSIDIQIPTFLKGDKNGLCDSIVVICKYLNQNLMNLLVDIDLLKVGNYNESIKLNVDVRGSNPDKGLIKSFITLRQEDIDRLLISLPYETIFFRNEIYAHFSFNMTFEYTVGIKRPRNLFEDKKILLAENNDLSALVFTSFLEEWGCQVTKVRNNLQALTHVKSGQYDAILMDIHMPKMPGIDAIMEIRKINKRIPIIAITSSSMKRDVAGAYIAGANNIIVKPANGEDLQKILLRYL